MPTTNQQLKKSLHIALSAQKCHRGVRSGTRQHFDILADSLCGSLNHAVVEHTPRHGHVRDIAEGVPSDEGAGATPGGVACLRYHDTVR